MDRTVVGAAYLYQVVVHRNLIVNQIHFEMMKELHIVEKEVKNFVMVAFALVRVRRMLMMDDFQNRFGIVIQS